MNKLRQSRQWEAVAAAVAGGLLTAACTGGPLVGDDTARVSEQRRVQYDAAAKTAAHAAIETFVLMADDPSCRPKVGDGPGTDCRSSDRGALTYERTAIADVYRDRKPSGSQTLRYRRLWVTTVVAAEVPKVTVQSVSRHSTFPTGVPAETYSADRSDNWERIGEVTFVNPDRTAPYPASDAGTKVFLDFIDDPRTHVTDARLLDHVSGLGEHVNSDFDDGSVKVRLGYGDSRSIGGIGDGRLRLVLDEQLEDLPAIMREG